MSATSVKIYDAIKQACLTGGAVKSFGLWNNQVLKDKDGKINPTRFPFVGITFENSYKQLSNGLQEIDGIFVLHICMQSLQHDDRDLLEFKDRVYNVVAVELPKLGFGNLYRSYEVQDTDHDKGLIVWQQEYNYAYVDNGAADLFQPLTGWTATSMVTYS